MMQGSLAERLRVLRAQHGLSLIEASEKIGVNRHTLRDLELGKREPYGPTIRKIAEGYNVPLARLLEEEPVAAGKAEAPEAGPTGASAEHEEHEGQPSLNDALEEQRREERRRAQLEEVRESYREEREEVARYLARWEQWLETGGIPEEAVREFLVAARAFYPALLGLLRSELTEIAVVLGIEPAPYLPDEAKAESSLMPLVDRYWELGQKLTEIWSERFPEEPPVDFEARRRETLRRRAV
jgi:transcriptional regulator with XRE-family HTH domain